MPLLTVIIPCYNHEAYVGEAVASVLAQTCSDLEIIVVDDGSAEPLVLERLNPGKDARVRLIRTENRGPAAARNTGIKAGTGKYIFPLDADDRIAKDYLECALECLEQDQAVGIVYCLAELFGRECGPWKLPDFKLPDSLFHPAIFSAALFRREDWSARGGYCESLRTGYEDHDLWVGIIGLGRKVNRIDRVLFYYRRSPDSHSLRMNFDQTVAAFRTIFQRHPSLFLSNIDSLFRLYLNAQVRTDSRHARTQLQIFLPMADGYDEAHSVKAEYGGGSWFNLDVDLIPVAGFSSDPIRLDPGELPGSYQIARVALVNRKRNLTLVELTGASLSQAAVVSGTAVKLPSDTNLRIISYGQDPQICLTGLGLPSDAPESGLSLQVHIHFDKDVNFA